MLHAFALRKRIAMGAMLGAIASATAAAAPAAAAARFTILTPRLTLRTLGLSMAIVLGRLLAVGLRALAFAAFGLIFGILRKIGGYLRLLLLIFGTLAAFTIAPASATAAAAATTA